MSDDGAPATDVAEMAIVAPVIDASSEFVLTVSPIVQTTVACPDESVTLDAADTVPPANPAAENVVQGNSNPGKKSPFPAVPS
jgi:hypothetical protein